MNTTFYLNNVFVTGTGREWGRGTTGGCGANLP